VKLAYVQSIHHNPLGVNLAPERRRALMALAGKYDFLVMEDCPYRDLCYAGEPELPLKSMDGDGRVVYIKSFAKIFSPGIRMAAVVADPAAAEKMVVARQFVDCCPSNLSQFLLLEFCRSGAMERHVEEMRRFYARRRDIMLAALDAHFPPEVRWTRPTGGFFVFAQLPGGMDAEALSREAMAEKVAFVPGRQFYIDGSGGATLRLSYAQAPEDRIEGAVEVLGRLIRKRMARKRHRETG
jgi:2-aminoadipate transaminase